MIFTGQQWLVNAAAALSAAALILAILKKEKYAFAAISSGALLTGLYMFGRGWLGGALVINPMLESPYFIPLGMALISAVMLKKNDPSAVPVLAGTLAAMLFGCIYSRGIIAPTPQKATIWAALFLAAENSALACFIAGGFGALRKAEGKDEEAMFHQILTWGFVFYSTAQIVGAWWCFVGWGNTFSWGPRHMTSAFIWLTYAAYIHLRFVPGWTERKRAVRAAAAGFMTIVMTYGHSIHEMTYTRIGGLL